MEHGAALLQKSPSEMMHILVRALRAHAHLPHHRGDDFVECERQAASRYEKMLDLNMPRADRAERARRLAGKAAHPARQRG